MNGPYEWDENKRRRNVDERNLDFAQVANFDWENATVRASNRQGEERFVAYGYMGDRMYAVVFTLRNGVTRIISFRRASDKEVDEYG